MVGFNVVGHAVDSTGRELSRSEFLASPSIATPLPASAAPMNNNFDGIPREFAAFYVPDPDAGIAVIQALYKVNTATRPDGVGINARVNADGSLGRQQPPPYMGAATPTEPLHLTTDYVLNTRMKDWHGHAANSFTGYLTSFQNMVDEHGRIAELLAVVLTAQLEIRRRMVADVWGVARITTNALEALSEIEYPSKEAVIIALSTAGAVAAVAASFGSATALELGLATAGEGLPTWGTRSAAATD